MKRWFGTLALSALLVSGVSALDMGKLTRSMEEMASGLKSGPQIQDSLYSGDAIKDAEAGLTEALMELNSQEDLHDAMSVADQFALGASHEQAAANRLRDILKKKALFLGLVEQGITRSQVSGVVENLKPVQLDEFLRPEDFMLTEVKPVDLVLYVGSEKWDDRKDHVEAVLKRHECDIHSYYHWDEDEEKHNYFATCKDYLAEPMVQHFGGAVSPNFEVDVELKAGGWFTSKSMNVTILQPEGSMEKSSLQYLKGLVEANPFQYVYDNNLGNLLEIGKQKEIGGELRLFLKNARAKIWYKAAGAERSEAIYFSEKEFGDLLLKGGLK